MNESSPIPFRSSSGGLNNFLLSHFPSMEPLTPMRNNIGAALCTVLFVKIVLEMGVVIRVKYDLPELSRKFVHLCACSWIVFWPLFDSNHWGWRLNVTVPLVMSVRLLYKGAIVKDPEDEDVRILSRTSSPSELLYGPLQMTIVMCYVGLTKFHMPSVGVIIMASFVGDWMAAMIGIHYGHHKYKIPFGGEKSIEGSIGCVLGTVVGMYFYSFMLNVEIMGWRLLLAYGVVSSVAEATAINNWDNLVLTIAMEISVKQLPLMLN